MKDMVLEMEDRADYILEEDELKALQKIAKDENKTVQELFIEIVEEFINKNITKIQESKK